MKTLLAALAMAAGFTVPPPGSELRKAVLGGLRPAVEKAGAASIRLNWTGGTGPFVVQKKSTLADATWMNVTTTPDRTALVPNDGTTGFFRVGGR